MNDNIMKPGGKETEAVLDALGMAGAPEADRAQVLEALTEHMTKTVLETVILALSPAQAEELKAALAGPDLEDRITEIAARIPGLARKIEEAVDRELEVLLKAARTGKQ